MKRSFYFDMAATGRRFPIATHLVLHEEADPEAALVDGRLLAGVMRKTAQRYSCPIALPVMDLTLEKEILLAAMGLPDSERAQWHCHAAPPAASVAAAIASLSPRSNPRVKANCEAISILAGEAGPRGSETAEGPIQPVGMSIGPFSLVSKLLSDPITPIFLAGAGMGPEDSEEVGILESLYPLAEAAIAASVRAQLEAGAKAIFVCEPAANLVYFSPKQIREGSPVFEKFVIGPNLRLKALLDSYGADLLFHDCGELVPEMIASFSVLDPALISFGSPVCLWEAAPHVPASTVIYGNLPTKKFYSDEDVPLERVEELALEIEARMAETGRAFIIGSECDVLSMPGYEAVIKSKLDALCRTRSCGCGLHAGRRS